MKIGDTDIPVVPSDSLPGDGVLLVPPLDLDTVTSIRHDLESNTIIVTGVGKIRNLKPRQCYSIKGIGPKI